MKEVDLAKIFVEYFSEGFDVFQEVHNGSGGIVDFYAVSGGIATAVEVKTSLSLAVLEQAYTNKPYAHYSYVATPTAPGQFVKQICLDFGIGVLVATPFRESVVEAVKPKLNRKPRLPKLMDFHRDNVAGSQNGRTTAFQNFVDQVDKFCTRAAYRFPDGVPIKVVFDAVDKYYGTLTACKRNLYHWAKSGVITQFEVRDGKIFPKPPVHKSSF